MFRTLSKAFKVPASTHLSFVSPVFASKAFVANYKPTPTQIFKTPELDPNSTAYAVAKEFGLQKFLNRMYRTTALSFGASLGVSYLAAAAHISAGLCLTGGIVGGLGSVIAFSFFTRSHSFIATDSKGNQYLTSENSLARRILYGTFVGSMGLSMSPILAHFLFVNPMIIATSLALTTSICSGASVYAYYKPKGSLLWLSGPLSGALITLIGVQLASLGASWMYGPNMFSLMAHRMDLYVGTGLFTAFVAYDTHLAILNYEQGNADHLQASLAMFLNFQNIFIRMLQIVNNFYGD